MSWRGVCVAVWCIAGIAGHARATSLSVPPVANRCTLTGGDGVLVLYSERHDEVVRVQYQREDGTIDPKAQARIAQVLRSPDGATHAIDPRLIRLLDQIQDHFQADTVEIISGFRSPAYNRELKTTGHKVARESRHLHGDAADVHLDEIDERAVRDYARSLRCGGVGFYPSLHFVHVDFGPVRSWAEVAGKRKLVGKAPITIETDKNYYRANDTVRWQPALPRSAVLQRFVRGEWQAARTLPAGTDHLQFTTPAFAYGKYRLMLNADTPEYSNEFYLKR